MKLQKINSEFTISKITNTDDVDFTRDFVFLSKTDDEISLVCESSFTPSNVIISEPGWNALRITGVLDFGMIGVIAKISNIFAKANISIFVISTYNTDYILLKSSSFNKGLQLLKDNGYAIK